MLQTEERSVRIATTDGLTVDGVIRVRGVSLQHRVARVTFEQQQPIAVVVQRHGNKERIALGEGGAPAMRLAWLAMPLAAGLAARMLRSSRKKGA